MNNKLLWYGFVYIVVAVGFIDAQTYPTIRSAIVQARVTHDAAQQMYYYDYSVFSDTANTGSIIEFQIDISRNPNSVDFDTTGLIFEDDFVLLGFREEYSFFSSRIVPVGFPHSPGIWYGDFSNYLTANFSGTAQVILPGESLSGFTMMSKGLPGIRYCIVEPDFDVVTLFPDYSDTTITDEQIDSISEAVKYRGFTVGPTAPPAMFDGLNFLDTIKSYINQARSLGWITNQTTANKYTRLIDSARSNLQVNNFDSVFIKLDSVLINVRADSATTLTSEAFALLRFNTEYVLKKLREYIVQLAMENKSVSANATAGNNQRKLYRESSPFAPDGAGALHKVFESAGEIFYCKSTDGGTTWSITKQISDGAGGNSRPSITGRYYHYATFAYVVWQKKNGLNWNITYNYSNDNGVTWRSSPITLATKLSCPSPGPIPAVMANHTSSSSFSLMTVYRQSNQLTSGYTTSISPTWPSNWTIAAVPLTNSASRNPSLIHYYYDFRLIWDENAEIYIQSTSSGTWSGYKQNISNGAYMVSDKSFPSSVSTGLWDYHCVWDGNYSGSRAIVHNKNGTSFWNVIQGGYRPSVSSNATYEATVAWYDNTNRVLNTSISGSPINSGSVLSSNGSYPSLSVNNPPGGATKAIWRDGSTSPYPIQVGNPRFQKASGQLQWKQQRIIAYQNREKGAELAITIGRLNAKGYDGNEYYASLRAFVENDSILRASPTEYLRSENFVLPRGVESAGIECSVSSKRLSHFADQLEVNLDLVSSESGKVIASVGNSRLSGANTTRSDVFRITSRAFLDMLVSGEHFIRVTFSGIKSLDSTDNVSCINVYEELPFVGKFAIDVGRPGGTKVANSFSFELFQNYPNPFNPATVIRYQIPEKGHVKITMYDVLGREVKTLVDEVQDAGYKTVTFDASDLPSGVYFYRMLARSLSGGTAGSFTEIKKMIILR